MTSLKISAILPVYNAIAFLEQALQSLVEQVDPLEEIIIVDDGSTDNSPIIIQKYMQQHANIQLIKHERNQGACSALNRGLRAASGDYVLFCAADDRYQKEMILQAREVLRQYPEVGLVCGDAMVKHEGQNTSFQRMLPFPKQTALTAEQFKYFVRDHYVFFNGSGSMLIQRKAILQAGMLFPALRWHCDWLLYFVVAFRQGIYYQDSIFVHILMRKEGYSEGRKDWNLQKQVMLDVINILHQKYPAIWNDFKMSALLPHYSPRYISLFLKDPIMRSFVTFKLLWKFLINNKVVIRIGKFFPYFLILKMKQLIGA